MAASGESEQTHSRWTKMWEESPRPIFDVNCSSPALLAAIKAGTIPEGRALVPGCGRGYDVVNLASPTRHAVGLDIVQTAVDAANEYLQDFIKSSDGTWLGEGHAEFRCASFFDLEEQFDFVYDYTFLCALDPNIRKQWAEKMAALVRPGGELFTLIFPIGKFEGGPPFCVSLELLRSLLEPVGFEAFQLEMLPSELSHPGRDGTGRWGAKSGIGRWRRK